MNLTLRELTLEGEVHSDILVCTYAWTKKQTKEKNKWKDVFFFFSFFFRGRTRNVHFAFMIDFQEKGMNFLQSRAS